MPRTNYRPRLDWPMGFAIPLVEIRAKDRGNDPDKIKEDKPTVLVDPYAEGMVRGLIEAVCTALELWEPTLDHWEDPPPLPRPKDGSEPYDTRRVPVFVGRHAHLVRKFRDDITQYIHTHRIEPSKQVYLKIASKYVHIRVTPLAGMPDQFGHRDTTHYHQEVIRPYVRRSDPEWDKGLVIQARENILAGYLSAAHQCVTTILDRYDRHHQTAHTISYEAEVAALVEDFAHDWEHLRLMAYYVQEVADYQFWSAEQGLVEIPRRRHPAKKVARKKVTRR